MRPSLMFSGIQWMVWLLAMQPLVATSCTKGRSFSRPTRAASSPKAGAMCTMPVPSVSVT